MEKFKTIISILTPPPQKAVLQEGPGLELTDRSKFRVSAPEAEYGPAMSAGIKLREFLQKNCGEDCFREDGIPVTLTLEPAPEGISNPEEGYQLIVNTKGITITGFGEKGLLYGVYTFRQLCRWELGCCSVPTVTILDWPDCKRRVIKEESRYGSNMMERQDWMEMIEELAERKINALGLALYGCWTVQYSGKLQEFLYLPVKGHPELQTPMEVRYFSPEENRWIDDTQLPPIFRDNLLEDIFRRCRDLGIEVIPSWNSYGHNTYIPRMIPTISAKEEDGVTPTEFGFCTENPETFDFLFKVYDQIIDEYCKPYGMHAFATLLDEVWVAMGQNAKRPFDKISPFCKCEKCKEKDIGQMFIDMVIKTTTHLKEKGIDTVLIANDMLKHEHNIPGLAQRLQKALEEADLNDTFLLDWWSYTDVESKMKFQNLDEDAWRNITAPWTGYHNWNAVYHPLENIRIMAEINNRGKGEGITGYSNWDRSCNRNYDCLADYSWNLAGTGTTVRVTQRYVRRNFGARYQEALRAYQLMDFCTEERAEKMDDPERRIISHFNMMLYRLGFYNYTYVRPGKDYPRNFPGEAVQYLMDMPKDAERELLSISSMAREAGAILRSLARDGRCNTRQALRMAYECFNYENTAMDFLTLLQMHDLTQTGDYETIAQLARQRQQARLDQLAMCEQVKEKFIVKALTMRNVCVYMQTFADIADYIESTENPVLDITDLRPTMSWWSKHLR